MGADQFGHGGSRKIPKSKIQKSKSGGSHKKKGCCSMVAAVRSARRGNYRLARRYVGYGIFAIGRRFA